MITQSNHNTILERVKILIRLNELEKNPNILCDITDFLYKVKSFDEYESMSMPTNIGADPLNDLLTMEWVKKNKNSIDSLSISFFGNQKIYIEASYPEMDIRVINDFPLNEDMANFVTTHLDNFKQPLKKKRYK
jgi:hypothetical protein